MGSGSDEEQARLAAERRAECLRLVAQDLGNPLTAIKVVAELQCEDSEEGSVRQDARDILQAADLASVIVEGMHAMLALEAGDEPLTWFTLDLVSILEDVVDRPALRRRIELDLPRERVIAGDRRALARAFTDVFANALRIAPSPSLVTVRLETRGPAVVVVVSHGGANMPSDLQHLLVDPYGATLLRRKRIPVLATGLTYAQRIFTRHGGGLELGDDAEGGLELRCVLAP